MRGELISIDGVILRPDFAPEELVGVNFTYQKVAVFGRRVAGNIDEESRRARTNEHRECGSPLWGGDEPIVQRTAHEITSLLDANSYPVEGGALVGVYFFPDGRRMICCERQLAWRDFSHTTGVRAEVVQCDVPFPKLRTTAALAAQNYATEYARGRGFDGAIIENGAGMLVSLGDAPLFGSVGNRVFTASWGGGAERVMGIEAYRGAGLEVVETGVAAADLAMMEELFAVTPWGLTSVGEVGGRTLPHSLAAKIVAHLK